MAESLLKEWQGPDRYGEDVLLWKFDWRDKLVMAWIEKLPQIGLDNSRENVKRLNIEGHDKRHTGTLLRSLFWKTWAVSGGDAQVFEARYQYYAKYVELAVGKNEPFRQLPPDIPGPRWKAITMPDRKRKAKPHVVTEMRSQASKFSTMLRRHLSFIGLTYMAYAMGDNKAAADTINHALMERESTDRSFNAK